MCSGRAITKRVMSVSNARRDRGMSRRRVNQGEGERRSVRYSGVLKRVGCESVCSGRAITKRVMSVSNARRDRGMSRRRVNQGEGERRSVRYSGVLKRVGCESVCSGRAITKRVMSVSNARRDRGMSSSWVVAINVMFKRRW